MIASRWGNTSEGSGGKRNRQETVMSKRFTGKRKEHVVKGEKQTITKKDVGTVKVDGEQPKQEAQAERKPVVIKVLKHDAKFRGAREAWYNRLKEFDGKPLD